ncbi:MAG: ABC transporter ATP-binding protein [Christensenellales bacterium]|jgi:ABC-2 type transport system ATP-binding protein
MLLRFEKVSYSYPEVLALDGVSFKVARGEIVGLIGANGAGKTTALLHIVRFLKPQSGIIQIDGTDIFRIKNEDFPVSYIPDTPVFYEELTLLEHLHFVKALYPDKQLSANEVIDRLELHEHLHKVPSALSRGTRQKLMIALALLRDYELLIADEPFSGLDPKQISVFRHILTECRQEKKAVLLSTHLLNMVDGICDRYIMLHRGRLIACGTVQDIVQRHSLSPDSTLEQVYLALVGREK